MSCGGLPARVVLPHDTIFPDGRYVGYWKYVRGTLEALTGQIELQYSEQLGKRGWSAFEILVDDEKVVIDYSDFALISPEASAFEHWLRFHYTASLVPYPQFGSFPPWSFLDWSDYETFRSVKPYTATGESIIYRHSESAGRMPNLRQRRALAMSLLAGHCADRLRTGVIPQHRYFQECLESLVVVHIPGSHPHILDRTVQQMFALGVCVISPDIWTTCLDERPQAGQHYVGILDDYSDLPEKIQWVSEHRSEAAAIGESARAFFAQKCTPWAIWNYIHRRLSATLQTTESVCPAAVKAN